MIVKGKKLKIQFQNFTTEKKTSNILIFGYENNFKFFFEIFQPKIKTKISKLSTKLPALRM